MFRMNQKSSAFFDEFNTLYSIHLSKYDAAYQSESKAKKLQEIERVNIDEQLTNNMPYLMHYFDSRLSVEEEIKHICCNHWKGKPALTYLSATSSDIYVITNVLDGI